MTSRYVLDEHGDPRPEPDLIVWAEWFEQSERRMVKQTVMENSAHKQVVVSTVFLGIDYNFELEGLPILWETGIFFEDGRPTEIVERYTSKDEALEGHVRWVKEWEGQ